MQSIVKAEVRKIKQNLQIILFSKMRDYTIVVAAVLIVSAALILPNIIASITRSHQIKPLADHPTDSAFIPKLPSDELQVKARELEKRIKALKNGNSCIGPNGDTCEHLKKQFDRLLAEADISLQKEANERLIYETKWNTSCQIWKNESQRLLSLTNIQTHELENNSIKIQRMASQISQLNIKIKNIKPCPICPPCKENICPNCPKAGECPDPQPCPDCEECHICQECPELDCPHCHDQDYEQLQHEYSILHTKFQECEELVEQYKRRPHEPQDCSHHQEEVKDYLKSGLTSLNNSLQTGLLQSQNLKNLVKKLGEKLTSSRSVEQSISILPILINGLTQEITEKSQNNPNCVDNHSKVLGDCMDLFKKAVSKLKDCENKLAPYIVNPQK